MGSRSTDPKEGRYRREPELKLPRKPDPAEFVQQGELLDLETAERRALRLAGKSTTPVIEVEGRVFVPRRPWRTRYQTLSPTLARARH